MRKLVAVIFFVLTNQAMADAPVCPHYELAELQGMTVDELYNLAATFPVTHYVYGPSDAMASDDDINCGREAARVLGIAVNKSMSGVRQTIDNLHTYRETHKQEVEDWKNSPEGIVRAHSPCEEFVGDQSLAGEYSWMSCFQYENKTAPPCFRKQGEDLKSDDPQVVACLIAVNQNTTKIIPMLKACEAQYMAIKESDIFANTKMYNCEDAVIR